MVDWSEIEALQNELEQVQQENVSSRLSDRNCVELVLKLKALGLVELINTTNGKCYLTPERLERDILRLVFYFLTFRKIFRTFSEFFRKFLRFFEIF